MYRIAQRVASGVGGFGSRGFWGCKSCAIGFWVRKTPPENERGFTASHRRPASPNAHPVRRRVPIYYESNSERVRVCQLKKSQRLKNCPSHHIAQREASGVARGGDVQVVRVYGLGSRVLGLED